MKIYSEHAELYDIAFSWNVEPEVQWLIEKLGSDVRVVLEPACGSGRMFPAFVRRGISVVGIDNSESMIQRAKKRMRSAKLPQPKIIHADMADFDLDLKADGAICPINSFGYLQTFDQAQRHLRCMGKHLRPGGKYLLQVDLRNLDKDISTQYFQPNEWEMDSDGIRLQTQWSLKGFDPETRIEIQSCRFNVLTGKDKGRTFEELHHIRLWNWEEWKALIENSPFRQIAAYNGHDPKYSELPLTDLLNLNDYTLTWHELLLR